MTSKTLFAIFSTLLFASSALAQRTEIETQLDADRAAATVPIAVPFPLMEPPVTSEQIRQPFYGTLTSDLLYSRVFSIIPLSMSSSRDPQTLNQQGIQALVHMEASRDGALYAIEVRLIDTSTGSTLIGKRYKGGDDALPALAHKLANDLVQFFNGQPGIFDSRVAFVSDRTGSKEVWIMDYDGANQRQITNERALTLTPDFSPDGQLLVYTSFRRDKSDLYLISKRGGERRLLNTGVNLNTSPAFSPDGRRIAFVGAVRGNPDIYVMDVDGSNVQRLTTSASIESTPSWSPNGREIAFTSSRAGSPQIYVMDAEGTNVRRISFDGNWNDDAVWSPDGQYLAFTSLVRGSYQIRIVDLTNGESRILAGLGSNEQPTWSPDGQAVLFMSNRSGTWQIYRIRLDEREPVQLTFDGNNMSPAWSR